MPRRSVNASSTLPRMARMAESIAQQIMLSAVTWQHRDRRLLQVWQLALGLAAHGRDGRAQGNRTRGFSGVVQQATVAAAVTSRTRPSHCDPCLISRGQGFLQFLETGECLDVSAFSPMAETSAAPMRPTSRRRSARSHVMRDCTQVDTACGNRTTPACANNCDQIQRMQVYLQVSRVPKESGRKSAQGLAGSTNHPLDSHCIQRSLRTS